ncbi:lysylphosphatidylglycerol synthase transmembrane domain-containing protein [Youxingia wuxianensis]|uniref:Phosphatidylglycerol lysyltransferase n=1 Tax=Youxingia wuxianensis TaxID=2763678 RepID=A0A926ET45_9FIRM|nr:lysylphosphatidylglycerol synthase transmembrane domain-containing protein [Youxingia wuxianensis]MBC8585805.1 flippase-like domain-containing protein [Youxingia wuxianensis]
MKIGKWNVLFIAAVFVGLIVYTAKTDGLGNLLQAALSANPVWLAAAVGLMVVYWLLEGLSLHVAVKRFYPRQRYSTSFKTSMIGQFFNCVTPFASGGQPMQAYHMVKTGVPLGISSCALIVKFIVYQFILTIYSLVTLIFHFSMFSKSVSGLGYLVLAGFGVNLLVIAGLMCICFFGAGARKVVNAGIHLLAKMRLVKEKQVLQNKAKKEMDGFYEAFLAMQGNAWLILKMGLLSIVQLTAFFLIPYALYRSFGLSDASIFSIISAQAFVLNLTSFVPLPGAAGGAELGFHAMFAMFFPQQLLSISLALWRLITFYFPICAGMFFTALFIKEKPRLSKLEKEYELASGLEKCG